MSNPAVSRLFDTYDEAVMAVYAMEQAGIPSEDISLVGTTLDPRAPAGVGTDPAKSPAGVGASIGATALGGVALLAGIGAIVIPGIGPLVAAGWFTAALTGAGVGAATGGVIGALTGLGVSNEHAHAAAEGLQNGGSLVVVRTAATQGDVVRELLNQDRSGDARSFDVDDRLDLPGPQPIPVGASGAERTGIERDEERNQSHLDRDR